MKVQAAIFTAVDVARGFGLAVGEPVPLRSTNNAVAWLCPSPVVAKISTPGTSRLLTELQVAQELVALGAPVVSPASEVPAIVHRRGGFETTFWRYHAQVSTAEISPGRVALALSKLHASLSQLSSALQASLPSYKAELGLVRSLLADHTALTALQAVDRDLLATTSINCRPGWMSWRLLTDSRCCTARLIHTTCCSWTTSPSSSISSPSAWVLPNGTQHIWTRRPTHSSWIRCRKSFFGSAAAWSA